MAHPSRRALLLSGGAAVLGAGVLGGAEEFHRPLIVVLGHDLDTGRVTLVG